MLIIDVLRLESNKRPWPVYAGWEGIMSIPRHDPPEHQYVGSYQMKLKLVADYARKLHDID